MHCVNELYYILIISIFNFLIFIHFTNEITLKQSLAQRLKLIFNFSLIKRQIKAEERIDNILQSVSLHCSSSYRSIKI